MIVGFIVAVIIIGIGVMMCAVGFVGTLGCLDEYKATHLIQWGLIVVLLGFIALAMTGIIGAIIKHGA